MSRSFTSKTSQVIDGGRNNTALNNQQPFTVMAWILPVTMGPASSGRIVCKDSAGGFGFWGLQFPGGTTFPNAFEFLKDYSTDLEVISVNNSITMNKWQQVAVTWDGTSAKGVHLYVDAIEVSTSGSSTDGSGFAFNDSTSPIRIGNRFGLVNRTFDGNIGPVEWRKGVLNAGQLGQLRAYPGSMDWNAILGFWTLENPSAATANSAVFDYGPIRPAIVMTPTSAAFSLSHPPINGLSVIPSPIFIGCA